jgi:hypothetical protein
VKTTRVTLLLTGLMVLSGCRLYEQQKDALLRTLAAGILNPVVAMQSCATLTQSTFRTPEAVAPLRIELPAPRVAAGFSPPTWAAEAARHTVVRVQIEQRVRATARCSERENRIEAPRWEPIVIATPEPRVETTIGG